MKDNFLLRKSLIDVVKDLSDEDVGKLFKGILNYVNTGESGLTGLMNSVFVYIQKDIDKNEESYQQKCKKNKENINKRWNKENQDIQTNTNVYERIPNDTDNNHISYINNHNSLINNQEKDNRVIGEEEKTKVEVLDNNSKIYHEVISYLNQVCGTSYRPTSKESQKHIKARLNDGFNVDDFKKVIDNMAYKWLKDEKMNRYLRPETLFGTKFESYLNEIPIVKPRTLKDISMAEIDAMIEYERSKENEEN